MPTRRASATWRGGLRNGRGTFEGKSGRLSAPYSFGTRFGGEPGSNPEELLAAAHAACYSMALSLFLEQEGHTPEEVHTDAACTIEQQGDGFRITRMELSVRARVPGLDEATFRRLADRAKENCPLSGALHGNLAIDLSAQLASEQPGANP